MDYHELDDATLLRLIARARESALTELYRRYHKLVYSLSRSIVGDNGAAEEVTLDVFTRVWEKADLYQSHRARVSTWLINIARNRSIDVLRRRGARPQHDALELRDSFPDLGAGQPSPEAATELAMERQRLLAAIELLPPEQQEVLALAYFRGYTHREIAAALDQPLGTVKTRLRLGVQKLRRALDSDEADDS